MKEVIAMEHQFFLSGLPFNSGAGVTRFCVIEKLVCAITDVMNWMASSGLVPSGALLRRRGFG